MWWWFLLLVVVFSLLKCLALFWRNLDLSGLQIGRLIIRLLLSVSVCWIKKDDESNISAKMLISEIAICCSFHLLKIFLWLLIRKLSLCEIRWLGRESLERWMDHQNYPEDVQMCTSISRLQFLALEGSTQSIAISPWILSLERRVQTQTFKRCFYTKYLSQACSPWVRLVP